MRSDMSKILVERPRVGGSSNDWKGIRSSLKQQDPDSLPVKQGIRKPHSIRFGYDRKQLNENLKPLYRFLNSKIGQNWDEIYSEIRENLNPNNAVQFHVLQHLEHMVENAVEFIDDKMQVNGYALGDNCFYVDKDGTLQKTSNERPKSYYKLNRQQEKNVINITDTFGFVRYNDIWYEVQFERKEYDRKQDSNNFYYDIFEKQYHRLPYSMFVSVKKRQLGKKELKKLLLDEGIPSKQILNQMGFKF